VPSIDLNIDGLNDYRPQTYRQPDFKEFWDKIIDAAIAQPLEMTMTRQDFPLKGVQVHQIQFDGFENSRLAGWFVRPDTMESVPGVINFHGYGGRGALPIEMYALALQGIAVMSMDCRGQIGDSSDDAHREFGSKSGWMTQGIRSKHQYYYRSVYADCVRTLEALASIEDVDEANIAVTGVSQGGGLSLAAAALSSRPVYCWADVPYLCDFRRAVEVATEGPYLELTDFMRARPEVESEVWRTLSYFDNLNLANGITCPVTMTVGLWDPICPPSTDFGVFSQLTTMGNDLVVLPYHRHELSAASQMLRIETIIQRLVG
jgi:cephalosporin-C deacetylase